MVLAEATRHLEALRGLLATFEPATLEPCDARALLELGCGLEALGAALKLRVAPRAVAGVPFAEQGHRSEAGWLAEATRSSVSSAIALIDQAAALESLPAIRQAVAAGELSVLETRSLVAAATDNPGAEGDLLDIARSLPITEALKVAKEVGRAGRAVNPETRRLLLSRRFCHTSAGPDGMWRLTASLMAEDGLAVACAIRSAGAHFADEAARAGLEPERPAAYEADALVALVRDDRRIDTFFGPEGGRKRTPELVLHVSQEALRRGHLEDGEQCQVPGVGPVSLEVAESLLGDATLKLVIENGQDVTSVTHMGRAVPAHLETALETRDQACVVPGCGVTISLEIDHWKVPFARGGPAALWNLARVCRLHHRMKTYDGWVLDGGPGKWEWHPPD